MDMNLEQTIPIFCSVKGVDIKNVVNAIESFLEQFRYDMLSFTWKMIVTVHTIAVVQYNCNDYMNNLSLLTVMHLSFIVKSYIITMTSKKNKISFSRMSNSHASFPGPNKIWQKGDMRRKKTKEAQRMMLIQ